MRKGNIFLGIVLGVMLGGVISWMALKQNLIMPATTTTKLVDPDTSISQKSVDFQRAMDKLWEDHITWTRMWLVSAANDNGDADHIAARLLKNQEDIGNAIKPYYGEEAGNKLTSLLKDHINLAVELVKAAKAKDNSAMTAADTKWYNNANDIADFLSSANANWKNNDLRAMMKSHLDLTKQEAVDILGKKYQEGIDDYDKVHDEIVNMSNALSVGIVKQYPDKFK